MFIDPTGEERIGDQGEPEGELDAIEEARQREKEMIEQQEEEEKQKSRKSKGRSSVSLKHYSKNHGLYW